MENIIDTIKHLASDYKEEAVGWRRHLHRHPELSQQEFGTMAFVAEMLKEMGLEPKTGIGKTGVMAMIRGGKNPDGYCVALRADYDALPLTEATGLPFASENPGVMHACGHDMHTSSLLCAAKILTTIREELEGSIMLIFEPSEEMYPGGARMMMDDGLFDKVMPNEIYSFHCLPEMDYGRIGMKKGRYMLSFGKFIGEGRTNIIPDEVKMEGIIRTFDPQWRLDCHEKIRKISCGIAESMGGECDLFIDYGYPPVINDDACTQQVHDNGVAFLGEEHVEWLDLRMTAEDFAFFAQKIPACYYRIGIHIPGTPYSNLHRPDLMVDERSIELAGGFVAYNAFSALRNKIKQNPS